MAIDLVPLCTIRIQLKPPIGVGAGPAGTRMIFELAGARAKGDRPAGELLGAAAADWGVLGPDGTGTLDIRWTLRTDTARPSSSSTTAGWTPLRACSSL